MIYVMKILKIYVKKISEAHKHIKGYVLCKKCHAEVDNFRKLKDEN